VAALTAELAERSIVCRQSSFQSDRDPKAVQAGQTEAATVVVIVGRRTDWVATGRNIRSFPFIARESARLGQFFFGAWAGGGESFIYRDSLSSPMLIRPCSLTENRVRTAQSVTWILLLGDSRGSEVTARRKTLDFDGGIVREVQRQKLGQVCVGVEQASARKLFFLLASASNLASSFYSHAHLSYRLFRHFGQEATTRKHSIPILLTGHLTPPRFPSWLAASCCRSSTRLW